MSDPIRVARMKRLRKIPHRLNALSCHPCMVEDPGSSTLASTIYRGTAVCWTHALPELEITGLYSSISAIDEILTFIPGYGK